MNETTIDIIQELLKTDSTNIGDIICKYDEYQSKKFAFQCADKNNETEREKELFEELVKRSNLLDDKCFLEYDIYKETKIEQSFQDLCQLYSKIVNLEIKKVNMFEITNNLHILNKHLYDKLCIIFDPKQIVLQLEKLQIVDYDNNDINECRIDLYQDVLFKYTFYDMFDLLYYCNAYTTT